MKKVLFALICLTAFSVSSALAGNGRDGQLIGSLDVKSDNTVHGPIKADNSDVNIGGVQAGGANISGLLKTDVHNEVGEIEATGGSTVSVGGLNARGMEASSVKLEAPKNKVDGKITATDQSKVYVGAANLEGMKFGGDVKIHTENDIQGDITATNGGKVSVGSVTN